MSGLVGVPAHDAARYTFFSASLTGLRAPVNTSIQWAVGTDIIRGRNSLVREVLEVGAEWLLFLDDDQTFHPDLLLRLLAHEQPIVASLYLQRQKPFAPVAFSHKEGDMFIPIDLTTLTERGLTSVYAAGTGGMLIRSEVFHAMEEPWFEHGKASEDLIFCEKARELGFPVYCDLDSRLGHITTTIVWPVFEEEVDEWQVGFTIANGLAINLPITSEITSKT